MKKSSLRALMVIAVVAVLEFQDGALAAPPIFTPGVIPDQLTTAGTAKIISFDINDDATPKKSLIVTASASNQALVSDANLFVTGNNNGFTLVLAAAGVETGQSIVKLIASDGAETATTSFLFTVIPSPTPVFANTTPITISDHIPANPYPSTITVSNVAGTLSRVIVTLASLNHRFPDDLDVLLVGPGGQKVMLMSDAGGGNTLTNARIVFDGAAVEDVPDANVIDSGLPFRPRDYESNSGEIPSQSGPFASGLSAFAGTNPNGVWSLYVMDDSFPDAGAINGGWILNILTGVPPSLTLKQVQELAAADGAASDYFGNAIALDGTTLVVGATNVSVGAIAKPGVAYVFTRNGTNWSQQQKLIASDASTGDFFGRSVAVKGDLIVVGAVADDVGGNVDQGSAYVFVRSGTVWTQQQKLTAPDGAASARFGESVTVDGDTIVVGAASANVGGNFSQGSAYVFGRSGTNWPFLQKLTASDGAPFDAFGYSLALEGTTLVVGAIQDSVTASLQGSAYIFARGSTGWIEQQKVFVTDGATWDDFGGSVALSGATVAVGAYAKNVSNPGQGAVYLFTRSGSAWALEAKVVAPDGGANEWFGYSVALKQETLVASAVLDAVGNNYSQGSAYIFTRTNGNWSLGQKLNPLNAGVVDNFGAGVAFDGASVVVGSPYHAVGGKLSQGAAFVFAPDVGDTVDPMVEISFPTSTMTNRGPVSYVVTYSDPNLDTVTLSLADITLRKTGTANATVLTGPGVPSGVPGIVHRSITLTNISGNGTLELLINPGTASDLSGNLASAAGPSQMLFVDNVPPLVVIPPPSTTTTQSGPVSYRITYFDAFVQAVTLKTSDVVLHTTGTASGTVLVTGGVDDHTRLISITNISGDGTLRISIGPGTATDLAGNLALSAASTNVVVVGNAPLPAPILSRIVRDSGFSSNDFRTFFGYPSFYGTAVPGSLVTVRGSLGSGVIDIGSALADLSGNWAESQGLGPIRELPEGTNIMTAVAVLGGSTSQESTPIQVVVDRTAPSINSPIQAPPRVANGSSAEFRFDFSEPVYGVDTNAFQLFRSGTNVTGTITAVSSATGTNFAVTVGSIAGDGLLQVIARSTSRTQVVAMANFQFTPPALDINVGDTVTWVNQEGNHDLESLSNTDPNSGWRFRGLAPITNFSVRFSQAAVGTFFYRCTFHTNFGMTGSITVHETNLIRDLAGNPLPAGLNFAGEPILIDHTPPAMQISSPSAPLTSTLPVSYLVTYTETNLSTITLQASNVILNATGTAIGTVLVGPGTDANSRTVTITNIAGSGTLGISIVAGTAADLAGNSAQASEPSAPFIVDAAGPAPPTLTSISADTGVSSSDFITSDNSLVLSGTAEPGALVSLWWVGSVLKPGDPVVASSSHSPGSEGAANAIDRKTTKYLNFDSGRDGNQIGTFSPSGFVVTPSVGLTRLKSMSIQSANDFPERDPAIVRLEGSSDASITDFISGNWEHLATITNIVFTGRFETRVFPVPASKPYRHYRWTVLATRVTPNGCCMHVAEVDLKGTTFTPNGTSAATGTGVWSIDLTTTNLADGGYVIEAVASDAAGNTSAPVLASFVVDTTPPPLAISPIAGDDMLGIAESLGGLVIFGTAGVRLAVLEDSTIGSESGRTVTVTLNGKSYSGAISFTNWSVTVPGADVGVLANRQTYTVTADVSDISGNAAQAARSLKVEWTNLVALAAKAIASKGSEITVPITALNFTNINSMQFSLHWDPAVAAFIGVEQFGLPGLTEGNFGAVGASAGVLRLSWDDPSGVGISVPNGAALFAIRFVMNGTNGAVSSVNIDGDPLPVEIINSTGALVSLDVIPGIIQIGLPRISGAVKYFADLQTGVGGVSLEVAGTAATNGLSGSTGSFDFSLPPGNYTVTPRKTTEDPPSKGVSTVDISLIRRHILSIAALDSPYKLLAADVNGSGTISTADIAFIRRLILDTTNSLPSGLWRFIRSNSTLLSLENPWGAEPFRGYTNHNADVANQDFIAIKLGDVNGSWTPAPAGSQTVTGSIHARAVAGGETAVPQVIFKVTCFPPRSDGTAAIEVSVARFVDVTSAQFSLEWDPASWNLLTTRSYGLPGLFEENFGLARIGHGRMTFSWDSATGRGVTLPDEAAIFWADFRPGVVSPGPLQAALADVPAAREVSVNLQLARFISSDSAPPSAPGPRITPASLKIAASTIEFVVTGKPDEAYLLQSSTDLVLWSDLAQIANRNGIVPVTLPRTTVQTQFYRLVVAK